jgi:hypothetical protein
MRLWDELRRVAELEFFRNSSSDAMSRPILGHPPHCPCVGNPAVHMTAQVNAYLADEIRERYNKTRDEWLGVPQW